MALAACFYTSNRYKVGCRGAGLKTSEGRRGHVRITLIDTAIDRATPIGRTDGTATAASRNAAMIQPHRRLVGWSSSQYTHPCRANECGGDRTRERICAVRLLNMNSMEPRPVSLMWPDCRGSIRRRGLQLLDARRGVRRAEV